MPSTFCPPQVTVRAIVARPSSTALTVAGDLDDDAAVVVGTTTGLVNLQPSSTTTSAPPDHSATARPASAIVYMPWAITPGSPTLRADPSSRWIGLRSPLAPA